MTSSSIEFSVTTSPTMPTMTSNSKNGPGVAVEDSSGSERLNRNSAGHRNSKRKQNEEAAPAPAPKSKSKKEQSETSESSAKPRSKSKSKSRSKKKQVRKSSTKKGPDGTGDEQPNTADVDATAKPNSSNKTKSKRNSSAQQKMPKPIPSGTNDSNSSEEDLPQDTNCNEERQRQSIQVPVRVPVSDPKPKRTSTKPKKKKKNDRPLVPQYECKKATKVNKDQFSEKYEPPMSTSTASIPLECVLRQEKKNDQESQLLYLKTKERLKLQDPEAQTKSKDAHLHLYALPSKTAESKTLLSTVVLVKTTATQKSTEPEPKPKRRHKSKTERLSRDIPQTALKHNDTPEASRNDDSAKPKEHKKHPKPEKSKKQRSSITKSPEATVTSKDSNKTRSSANSKSKSKLKSKAKLNTLKEDDPMERKSRPFRYPDSDIVFTNRDITGKSGKESLELLGNESDDDDSSESDDSSCYDELGQWATKSRPFSDEPDDSDDEGLMKSCNLGDSSSHTATSNTRTSITLHSNNPREDREGRQSSFAKDDGRIQNSRISKDPTNQTWDRAIIDLEVFFYNRGMEIALVVLYVCLNILAAAHGAYQFTEAGGFVTENHILRVTLPIARAGGRLVTLNCAILLLTASKYLWTCVRTYIIPVVPVGFPIDNIMPKYHRIVALTIIVSGCIVHTIPQIVNYASKAITFDQDYIRFWTFGDGFATKQLLITGTLLSMIFSTFFLTTLKAFRRTTAGFRWFWFFHMGGIATAYPLLLLHGTCKGHPVLLYTSLLPLVMYIFDVVMRRSNVGTAKIVAWKAYDDDGQQITELEIERPPGFAYTPGQYAELRFSPVSHSEWHPFTIASAPDDDEEEEEIKNTADKILSKRSTNNDENVEEEEEEEKSSPRAKPKTVVFYIKSTGRWTSAFYDYAAAYDLSKARKALEIEIRGPHGAPAMNYFEYKHIMVVGSGVGVTPLLSIWKYLMAKGKRMCQNNDNISKDIESIGALGMHDSDRTLTSGNTSNAFMDSLLFRTAMQVAMASTNGGEEFDGNEEFEASMSPLRKKCMQLEHILDSMSVSMSFFLFFVVGETITIVLQMVGRTISANLIGATLSVIALLVHGTTAVVSIIAVGWIQYSRLFQCWIECGIILVDAFALWLSSKTIMLARSRNGDGGGNSPTNNWFLVFFGMVLLLHAVRIFHIFYITLKPASHDNGSDADNSPNNSKHSVSASLHLQRTSLFDNLRKTDPAGRENQKTTQEICSVECILINRLYSNMSFAARNLLPSMLEQRNLAGIFSMSFYGTREKAAPKKKDNLEEDCCIEQAIKDDCGLITDLMGSAAHGMDVHSSLIKQRQPTQQQLRRGSVPDASDSSDRYFHPGRPDWHAIFSRALSKAHATNPRGETLGVFFCGSPAIVKDLQLQAAKVTAQHQYATKQLMGRACKCKIIVHSENF